MLDKLLTTKSVFVKYLSKFTGIQRTDLVFPNKNPKIPKNTWYLKTHFKHCEGFDLTFQKRYMSFLNTNYYKTYFKCYLPFLRDFLSRSSETALNSIFLPFYLTEKHQVSILYQKTFIKNEFYERSVLKITWKNS